METKWISVIFQFFPGKIGYSVHTYFLRNAQNKHTNKSYDNEKYMTSFLTQKSLLIVHGGTANSLLLRKRCYAAFIDKAIALLQKIIIHVTG